MRNFSLHRFLAMLLMAVSSATLSVAQNVAKIGSTEYATLKEAVDAVQPGWRKRSIPTHSGWLYPLTFDAGKGLKEA